MASPSTPLLIVGSGGFGREVHDVVDAINERQPDAYELLGFLDDGNPDAEALAKRGTRHLGGVSKLEDFALDVQYVIGIGNGVARRKIDAWATGTGRQAATLVHPTATFGRDVVLSPGTIVCAYSSATSNIRIGRHAHLNLHCTVGHDSRIGDYVTLYPGVHVSGQVHILDGASIGTGAAIIQGITIGEEAFIGAAAGVVRDIPPGVTAVGVPARPR